MLLLFRAVKGAEMGMLILEIRFLSVLRRGAIVHQWGLSVNNPTVHNELPKLELSSVRGLSSSSGVVGNHLVATSPFGFLM